MDAVGDDWSDWNPMDHDFHDEASKKYENGPGADLNVVSNPASDDKKERDRKQLIYPYLVIRKHNKYVTEIMLTNYFGESLIQDMEYREMSRVYFVYFKNIASIESALTRIQQFPLNLEYTVGRPKNNKQDAHAQYKNAEENEPMPTPVPTYWDDDGQGPDLELRKIFISSNEKNHPEFFRPSLVTKNYYTTKGSLLAINDRHQRYLNVKYEFALERHGVYVLSKTLESEHAQLNYRSGRVLAIQQNEKDFRLTADKCDESLLLDFIQNCAACNLYTDISCKHCDMPYCNAQCFEELFEQHRNVCGKVDTPAIWKPTDKQKQTFENLQMPPSGASVKITSFEQSNVVYIRSVELDADVAYFDVLRKVMSQGKDAPRLSQLPQAGQIVIYKFDTEVLRAMVLNVDDPEAIYVVCVEFGNLEITKLEQLHECSAQLAALPRYAIPVLLRGVPKRYMGPDLRELFYDQDQSTYVLKYSEREFDLGKGMQRVVLIESDHNFNFNRLLNTFLTPTEPKIDRLQEDYLTHVHLPAGQHIDMAIMNNSYIKCGILHCTIVDFAYEITRMQRDIQAFGESKRTFSSYAPSQKELCVAKYQGKWVRGLCLEIVGDGYPSILFIDFGHITPIHVNNIRPYPPKFSMPMLTTEFELLGLPAELSDEMVTRLEQHLPVGAFITCDEIIYNKKENNYMLRIDKLLSLIETGN